MLSPRRRKYLSSRWRRRVFKQLYRRDWESAPSVNRSDKCFAYPDSFIPERWLPQGERLAEYDNDQLSASKPFSVGFYSCLGRPLALVELRLVLTGLRWAFDLVEEPAERVDSDDFPVIMLIPKEAVRMRLKIRMGVEYEDAPDKESLKK